MPWSESALILCAHGATQNLDSSTATHELAARLKRRAVFREVASAFVQERPHWSEAADLTTARTVYLVPNFVAEGYFTSTVLPREFGLTGPVTHKDGRTFRLCKPVGTHPSMTRALLARAAAVTAMDAPDPQQTAVLVVGHGTDRNPHTGATLWGQVEQLRATGRFARVDGCFMEMEPLVSRWAELVPEPNVLVLPFFISNGLHCVEDIPELIGIPGRPDADPLFAGNPYFLQGRRLWYAPAIGTEPSLASVVLDLVRDHDDAHP